MFFRIFTFSMFFLPCFDVMPELLSVDWDVVLVHPVGIEDGTLEGQLAVDVGEVADGNLVDVLHRPERQNRKCQNYLDFKLT